MKISEMFQEYRQDRLFDGYSESTMKIYDWAFQELVKFLGDLEADQITKDHLKSYLYFMRTTYRARSGKQLSGSSVDNIWKGLRSFFGWAQANRNIPRPDNELPRVKKYSEKEIKPFTKEEIQSLLDNCKYTKRYETAERRTFKRLRPTGLRDEAMILFLVDTGVRVSEMCRVTVKDIDFKAGDVEIREFGSGQKTKERTLYLDKRTLSSLSRYLRERGARPDEVLFYSERNQPMDANSVKHLLMRLGERAGVKNVHAHRFRHTFATQFLRNGGSIEQLARMLGHSTFAMSLRYAEITHEDLREAHRKFSVIGGWRL